MLISTNQESEHYLIGNPLNKKKKKPATATTTDTTIFFQSTRTKAKKERKEKFTSCLLSFFSLVFILLFPPLKNLYFFLSSTFRNLRARPTSNYQVISHPFCIIFHIYQTSCVCTWKKKTIPRQKEVEEDQKTDLNTTIFSIESSSKISSSNTASLYSVKISRNQEKNKSKQHKTNNMPRRNKKGGKGK